MKSFITEFPVNNDLDSTIFITKTLEWIKGIKNSSILENHSQKILDEDACDLECAKTKEKLSLRRIKKEDGTIISGFRYDIYDSNGRLWRTEGVLHPSIAYHSILQFRSTCKAEKVGAKLEYPKKPHLIKILLKEEYGGVDGILTVQDKPHFLENNEVGLRIAENSILGKEYSFLPVIYISKKDDGRCIFTIDELNKLSYELGGIAHVIVEPSRSFSFELRERVNSRNPYDGAIGIALPTSGIRKLLYMGWRLQTQKDIFYKLISIAKEYHNLLPKIGWDWSTLQEEYTNKVLERERDKLSFDEIEDLLRSEIKAKDDLINSLKAEIGELSELSFKQIDQKEGGGNFRE